MWHQRDVSVWPLKFKIICSVPVSSLKCCDRCAVGITAVVEVNLQFEELDLLSGQPKGGNLGFAYVSQACPSVLSLAQKNLVQIVATKHNKQCKYLPGIWECWLITIMYSQYEKGNERVMARALKILLRLDAIFRTVGKDMYQLLLAKRAFGVRSRLVNQTDYQIYAS